MSLNEFLVALDALETEALSCLNAATEPAGVEEARVRFVGAKNGQLKNVQKQLGAVPVGDKPAAGKRLNEVKERLQTALDEAAERVKQERVRSGPRPDPTLPGTSFALGRVHPVTQTIEHLKEIMGRMGFEVAEGPEVEDPWHNFVALNIPEDHPARDPLDNFYLATQKSSSQRLAGWVGERLLRSQTSTVQIRVMETRKPPIRIISLGRVYRPDEADATHFPMFHQMEGLFVDTGVTMANLKTVLKTFAANYLGSDVPIRFRPSFFPFTEPSVEVDFFWNNHWIEFGGAGMVDPAVLTSVGYDPEQVTGFAFGLGVERLCMRRHGIKDIRYLYSGDVRFLRQF